MKRFFSVVIFVVLGFFTSAVAQKKLSEGTISYDIVVNTSSNEPQPGDFFDGAFHMTYLKGNKSRTEMISSLGKQSTIVDRSKNAIFILREFGAQKFLINLTPDNWKEYNAKNENIDFTFTDETKNILGYNCKKAVGKLGDGTTYTVWYTTDLVPDNKDFDYMNRSLPGLAMEYESNIGKYKVIYKVSKINMSPVPAATFDMPKAGFRVLNYEESKGNRQ